MPGALYFISYSRADGEDFALRLGDQLTAGPPSIGVWVDRRRLQPGIDWDEQLVEALRACEGFLYVMTEDSVSPKSECKKEWTRALKYKKPIIPLLFHRDAELPYRLDPRQHIDFTHGFDAGLARLREHVRWRGTPEGVLHTLKERLEDARRDIARAETAERPRIQEEIAELERQIGEQRQAIENPQAAQQRTEKSIQAGFERERQPTEPFSGQVVTRFINRLPMIPPAWFQDRHVETGLIGTFLKDESLRLMTVVGRGGVGKTAMVCRLLRSLEGGKLPDDGGALAVDGIVYLSARAGHPVNFPNLFADLCKLLPEETAKRLDQLYRDAKQSTGAQMQALLAAFPGGRTILLLDNFEEVVDAETQAIKERELDEALRTALEAPPHGVKFLLTTRVAPQTLLRTQPALQQSIELDEGLEPKFAIEVLRALDQDGKLKLKKAPKKRLAQGGPEHESRRLAGGTATAPAESGGRRPGAGRRGFQPARSDGTGGDAGARRLWRAGAGGGGRLSIAAVPGRHRQRSSAGAARQHAVRPRLGWPVLSAPGRPRLRAEPHSRGRTGRPGG
jgi:TIR domain-containing protein/NACHT domain-containing protein